MTSLTKALRAEMRAAARGESKASVDALRSELLAIRKSIALLERRLLTGLAAGAGSKGRNGRVSAKGADGRRARFSSALMRRHRDSLGMSRKAYSRLLGVSSLSIYLWEAGRTKPRRQTVLAWQDLRKKGARELRAIAGVAAPPRRRKKRAKRAAVKKRSPRAAAKKRVPRAVKKRARRTAAKRMGRAKAA